MTGAERIEQQAAHWLLRREEPGWTTADQAALEAWLAESMAHKAAFWRLEHGWKAADRLAALGGESRPAAAAPPSRPQRRLRRWWPLAVAASLLIAIGLSAVALVPKLVAPQTERSATDRFATAVGARKTIALPDGSRVELNTATVARARITGAAREFWLDQGEAYFEVAHAPDRPFRVHAGQRTITVLGTRFSVRRDSDRVSVVVAEGRVRIDPAGADGAQPSSTIGGGAVAIAQGPSTLVASPSPERVENSLAWRRGMLAFDQTTLADAAAEFNRYNRRQIVIADPATAAIRIGGTFRADNVEAFVRLLHHAYGLRVEDEGEQTRISG